MIASSPPLAFFGMGDTEVLLVMVMVLIFFGGQKMPDFARGLGKALRELRKASGEVEREFKRVLDEAENSATARPAVSPPAKPTVPASPEPWPSPSGGIKSAELPKPTGTAASAPPPGAFQQPPAEGPEYHSDI